MTCLLLFVFISIGATHRFFFVSTFAISSSIMYLDSFLDGSSECSSWCNWVDGFCLQTFAKRFFFPHFLHLSPCNWIIIWGLMFPLSPTISRRCFLVSTSFEISSSLVVSFPVWIICLISLWLLTILPVSSSVTNSFLLVVLLL